MSPPSPQDESSIREPHPLVRRLIERLPQRAIVLDFATGSGRNAAALARAGFQVVTIGDVAAAAEDPVGAIEPRSVQAVISTHGFLHGTAAQVARRLDAVACRLECGGFLYATLGSTHDRRFGRGTRIDAQTYAPVDGDERGLPHAFFDERQIREILEPLFTLDVLEEHTVDDVAGSWAHRQQPLSAAVHWFVGARRNAWSS